MQLLFVVIIIAYVYTMFLLFLLLNITNFFVCKTIEKSYWLDFSLILFIAALLITSLNDYGIFLVYYLIFVIFIEVIATTWNDVNMIIDWYERYKNSYAYQIKKLEKEKIKFNKQYAKTELLLEKLKNKELAKANDENEKTNIENKNENLKNAFIFLAYKHKIIINRGDIKIINKVIEQYLDENKSIRSEIEKISNKNKQGSDNVITGGIRTVVAFFGFCPVFPKDWITNQEIAYMKILARHQEY